MKQTDHLGSMLQDLRNFLSSSESSQRIGIVLCTRSTLALTFRSFLRSIVLSPRSSCITFYRPLTLSPLPANRLILQDK